jgi:hypothetical protein
MGKKLKIVKIDECLCHSDKEKMKCFKKKIPIYKYKKVCWKCGKETTIITYSVDCGSSRVIGDIKDLDEKLMRIYPFIRETYSKTRDERYVANLCEFCDALQGQWFIHEDLIVCFSQEGEMDIVLWI